MMRQSFYLCLCALLLPVVNPGIAAAGALVQEYENHADTLRAIDDAEALPSPDREEKPVAHFLLLHDYNKVTAANQLAEEENFRNHTTYSSEIQLYGKMGTDWKKASKAVAAYEVPASLAFYQSNNGKAKPYVLALAMLNTGHNPTGLLAPSANNLGVSVEGVGAEELEKAIAEAESKLRDLANACVTELDKTTAKTSKSKATTKRTSKASTAAK